MHFTLIGILRLNDLHDILLTKLFLRFTNGTNFSEIKIVQERFNLNPCLAEVSTTTVFTAPGRDLFRNISLPVIKSDKRFDTIWFVEGVYISSEFFVSQFQTPRKLMNELLYN